MSVRTRMRRCRNLTPLQQRQIQAARALEIKARILETGVGHVLTEGFYDEAGKFTQLLQEELSRAHELTSRAAAMRERAFAPKRRRK